MQERACPSCGMRFTPDERAKCPHCGRHLDAELAAPDAPVEETSAKAPGEPTPARSEPSEQPEAPPPPVEEAPVPPAPPAPVALGMPGPPVADGQRRCPHCGEALYADEQVCWSCGKRVDEVAEPPAEVPMTVPVTAEAQPPAEPVRLAWDELPPPQPPEPAEAEAMRAAWWSLGLGLAALLTCGGLSIVAPIALWLGLKATRGGAGPVGVVGLVMGVLGTLALFVILVAVVLMIIGMSVGGSQAPTEVLAPGGPLAQTVGGLARCA